MSKSGLEVWCELGSRVTYDDSNELGSRGTYDESAEPVTANFLCLVGRPFGFPLGLLGFLDFRLLMANFLFFFEPDFFPPLLRGLFLLFLFPLGRPLGRLIGRPLGLLFLRSLIAKVLFLFSGSETTLTIHF